MVECRDWLKTLWRASYKGVPFYFEADKEKGGRDNVKHTFPHSDLPFIEDMGEALRFFSGSAYVHGDDADAQALALKEACASYGPGPLVVPYFGPVTVHCETFERATQRDQMGYVAFEVEFVRAGASTALISVPYLQNVAFGAVDNLQRVFGQLFPLAIATLNRADHVVAAVADGIAGVAAAADVLRQSYPTEPVASAKLRDQIAAFVASVPAAINDASAPGAPAAALAMSLIDIVRGLSDALPAETAATAALELVAAYPAGLAFSGVPYLSPSAAQAATNAEAVARLARLAGLMAYADATLRRSFASRPDGVTARGEVAERFENEMYDTTGAALAPLYVAIDDLRGKVIEWLTRTINDLAPVIVVESARILPSLALSWALYQDPMRATELVTRNQVRSPAFMPRTIEALAR